MTMVDLSALTGEHDIRRLFSSRSLAAHAVKVLQVLAAAERPLTRSEICDELTMARATLASCMEVLERDGHIVSSRRFAVTLGARFLDDAALSRVFRETTVALVRPHLDSLVHRFDGTASLAFGTTDSCLIADTSGPAGRAQISESSSAVLAQAIRGTESHQEAPALTLRGVWAGYASEETIVIAGRVRLRANAGAAIGLTIRTLTLTEFSEVSQAVFLAASQLSSAFRRVYPLESSHAFVDTGAR